MAMTDGNTPSLHERLSEVRKRYLQPANVSDRSLAGNSDEPSRDRMLQQLRALRSPPPPEVSEIVDAAKSPSMSSSISLEINNSITAQAIPQRVHDSYRSSKKLQDALQRVEQLATSSEGQSLPPSDLNSKVRVLVDTLRERRSRQLWQPIIGEGTSLLGDGASAVGTLKSSSLLMNNDSMLTRAKTAVDATVLNGTDAASDTARNAAGNHSLLRYSNEISPSSTPLRLLVSMPHLLQFPNASFVFPSIDAVTLELCTSVEALMSLTARDVALRCIRAFVNTVVLRGLERLQTVEADTAFFRFSFAALKQGLQKLSPHAVEDEYDRGYIAAVIPKKTLQLWSPAEGTSHDRKVLVGDYDEFLSSIPQLGIPLRGEVPLTALQVVRRWSQVMWSVCRFEKSIHEQLEFGAESQSSVQLDVVLFVLRPQSTDGDILATQLKCTELSVTSFL